MIALASACGGHDRDPAPGATPAPEPAPPVHADARPAPRVQITSIAIAVDGARVAGVHDGAIDAMDLTPAADGEQELLRLRNTITASARPDERITIEIDPLLHFDVLVIVLTTLARAQYLHVALVSPPGSRPVDLDLRRQRPPTDAGAPAINALRMVVGLDTDDLMVFSTTGTEGTQDHPKLVAPRGAGGFDTAAMQQALRGVVDAHWGTAPRTDDEQRIIVAAGREVHAGDVIMVVGATRADAKGVLFPDTQLSEF